MLILIEILTMIVLVIYHLTFFRYYKMYNPVKRHAPFIIAISVIVNAAINVVIIYFKLPRHYIAILMAVIFWIEIKLIFDISNVRVFFGAGFHIFHIYVVNGMLKALIALFLNINIAMVYENVKLNFISVMCSMLLMVIWAVLVRKYIIQDYKMKQLLQSKHELTFVTVCEYLLFFYLLIIDFGQDSNLFLPYQSMTFLVTYILSYLIQWFILNNSIRVSYLMEVEMHTKILKEQLERQMRHYNSYKKYTESFRVLKHDYKNVLTSVKYYVENMENSKAVRLLEEIDDVMLKSVVVHKNYSNNFLVDAILQDAANVCEENEITFHAEAYIPEDINLSDIDIVRVFSNLITNSLEAASIVPESSDRYIEIKSFTNHNWVTTIITNSFIGELNTQENKFKTTKEDKYIHGFGLGIVTDIIEGLGGVIQIDANTKKKIFQVKISAMRKS